MSNTGASIQLVSGGPESNSECHPFSGDPCHPFHANLEEEDDREHEEA